MSATATATIGRRMDGPLWRALSEARRDGRRRTAAHVEDALFRLHLPMARQLADVQPGGSGRDARHSTETAEIALCRAILRWSPARDDAFAPWAAALIADELAQMVATEPPSTR